MLRSISIGMLLLATLASRADAQSCDGRTDMRVEQENYAALTDRVYVYVPDIPSLGSSGGWQSFTVRILSSRYRKPLLLSKAFLKERDLQGLLSGRRDIKQGAIVVPAYSGKGGRPALGSPATMANGEKPGTITVRVNRVVPVSKGTDHLFVTCSIK